MIQAESAAGGWSPRHITASVALALLAIMGVLAMSWLARFAQQFYRAGKILEPIPRVPAPSGVSSMLPFHVPLHCLATHVFSLYDTISKPGKETSWQVASRTTTHTVAQYS